MSVRLAGCALAERSRNDASPTEGMASLSLGRQMLRELRWIIRSALTEEAVRLCLIATTDISSGGGIYSVRGAHKGSLYVRL